MDNHAYLPLSQTTYMQRLRDHGYHVGGVGKFDLAKPEGYNGMRGDRPLTYAWGFTMPHECEGKMHAGRGNPPNGPYTHWLREQDPAAHERFCSDYERRKGNATRVLDPSVLPAELTEDVYIGQQSCAMLRDFPADYPWHLFVSFVGPHNPFDPPGDWFEKFKDTPMPPAVPRATGDKPARYLHNYPDPPTDAQIELARRLYTAYLACIDERIGHILRTLEDTGQADHTYIAFAADHGEMLGDHGRWTKGVQYEASLRVPLMVAGPGIEPGESDALVELNDLNPTLCELGGVAPAPDIDARSLLPVLRGQTPTHRDFTMATHLRAGCVRTAEWKAIIGEDGHHELYDLANDPGEQHNVMQDHPAHFESMRQQYIAEWIGSPRR